MCGPRAATSVATNMAMEPSLKALMTFSLCSGPRLHGSRRRVVVGRQLLVSSWPPCAWWRRRPGLGVAFVEDGAGTVALRFLIGDVVVLLGQVQERLVLEDRHLLGIDRLSASPADLCPRHGGREQQRLPLLGGHATMKLRSLEKPMSSMRSTRQARGRNP